MTDRDIIICHDLDALSRRAAAQFVALAQQAIAVRGRFSVSLSGGSTPKALYSLIATDEFKQQLAWQQIHLFWGDERCVAPDHAVSNFRMVKESLLSKIPKPSENVHRMAGAMAPLAAAAPSERELKQFFSTLPNNLPRFDLVLLGLGEDGHTASLFPGSSALNEAEHLVAPTYVDKLDAHRLTLTLPLINRAAQVSFLVTGQSKAAALREVLHNENSNFPAAKIRPVDGRLSWLVTEDAVSPSTT